LENNPVFDYLEKGILADALFFSWLPYLTMAINPIRSNRIMTPEKLFTLSGNDFSIWKNSAIFRRINI
jgi:hypothetical protein